MKRNILIVSVAFIFLVGACAPQATPTINPADVAATAQAAALTMVAQTQQALPTNTPVPTETASPTPLPTDTQTPSPTLGTPGTQETSVSGELLPTTLPTFTPQSSASSGNSQDQCNQPLTSWQGPTAHFSISNQTKPKGTIVLSMYVVTDMGQCGYLVITGDGFNGPAGQYSASAFITGKKNIKSFGGFKISGGNWKIVVRNDKITAAGSCYPDC